MTGPPARPLSAHAIQAVIAVLSVLLVGVAAVHAQTPRLDVPYVRTPEAVVAKMLELGRVGPNDFLIDLGSGDGRIPITAASRFGTQGFGVDIDPRRISEARANAEKAGVSDKVTFKQQDLFHTDISKATVLTLYLLPDVNLKLRPRILQQLRPGTRVVSHAFDMGDWQPDRTDLADGKTVYLWTVPAAIEGRWEVSDTRQAGTRLVLELNQKYRELSGRAKADGRTASVINGRIDGDRVSFEIDLGGERKRYEGEATSATMTGDGWTATRTD